MLTEVAGIKVPEGHAAEAARLVCAEYADEALYHHSVRAYFFGAAWAEERGLDYDRELFFVSALLHDLSLMPPFDSHTLPFEEAGGHLARVFTAGLGWPDARRDRAAELIVLHMRDDVSPDVDVESRIVAGGDERGRVRDGAGGVLSRLPGGAGVRVPATGLRVQVRGPVPRPGSAEAGVCGGGAGSRGWESRALGNGLDRG